MGSISVVRIQCQVNKRQQKINKCFRQTVNQLIYFFVQIFFLRLMYHLHIIDKYS